VRINGNNTAWHEQDLSLLECPGLLGVMVPKAQAIGEAALRICRRHRKAIIPLVETAVGFSLAAELAQVPGVVRMGFGHLDFQLDMGIDGDDDALLYFRSQLVLISRLAI
jgi:citrate lyase subunit beta/citryl-CoA lyase